MDTAFEPCPAVIGRSCHDFLWNNQDRRKLWAQKQYKISIIYHNTVHLSLIPLPPHRRWVGRSPHCRRLAKEVRIPRAVLIFGQLSRDNRQTPEQHPVRRSLSGCGTFPNPQGPRFVCGKRCTFQRNRIRIVGSTQRLSGQCPISPEPERKLRTPRISWRMVGSFEREWVAYQTRVANRDRNNSLVVQSQPTTMAPTRTSTTSIGNSFVDPRKPPRKGQTRKCPSSVPWFVFCCQFCAKSHQEF